MSSSEPLCKLPTLPTDHAAVMEAVECLSKRYEGLFVTSLGSSILGKEIPLLRIGTGARSVLYVGAHHGMEWITASLLLRFVGELCECVRQDRSVYRFSPTLFFKSHSLYVIPMLNPDGVEYQLHGLREDNPLRDRVLSMNQGSADFSHWQANARGVDLNHNYNAGFGEYKRLEAEQQIPCGAPTRYSGQEPESEPEVRELCDLIRCLGEELRFVMTLHTQGEEIYYKSGERFLPNSLSAIQALSRMSGYRLSEPVGPAAFGGLTDWCLQKMEIPSATVECGLGENPLPISDFFPIYARLRKLFFLAPTLF